jgi:PilZ domain
MSAPRDYYRILHVQPDAPAAIIHASYRTLAQRAQNTGKTPVEVALLDEAYAVLGDSSRRAVYDARRNDRSDASLSADAADEPDVGLAGTRTCLFCGTPHGLKRTPQSDDECGRCGSPLCPAERHRLEYAGQRVIQRIPKECGIAISVTWPQSVAMSGTMRDVSLNGMLFTTDVHLQLHQIVRIDCTQLRALGRVAHVEPAADNSGRWNAGVEFLTLRFRQVRGTFVAAQA